MFSSPRVACSKGCHRGDSQVPNWVCIKKDLADDDISEVLSVFSRSSSNASVATFVRCVGRRGGSPVRGSRRHAPGSPACHVKACVTDGAEGIARN